MKQHGLSKSRLSAWRQCPKRLWLQIHKPELMAISAADEQRFMVGYEVGDVAQSLHPSGILIDDESLTDALLHTQEILQAHPGKPVFEATFQHDGLLVRCDVLIPTARGFRMVEVKSSASVKPYHIDDCAMQAWVLQQNNLQLAAIELAHIDTSFVYQGDGNYHGLFNHEKLDSEILPLLDEIPDWIADARQVLASDEPDILPGPQCDDPFECPFKDYCAQQCPAVPTPAFPLSNLYRLSGATRDTLLAKGYRDVRDVPPDYLNETQRRIQRAAQTGQSELSPTAAQVLSAYPYPRYYLDFETIALAVPRFAQTSPYRTQVPFQWSCHIEHADGTLAHDMFLDVSGEDPRRACAESLVQTLGNHGPIFVYYQAFEKGRINEMAELYPDLAPALQTINHRIVDLLPIARAHYYHPDMQGSWSIKAVLPTIAPDLVYGDLAVSGGMEAQDAYREIVHPQTSEDRKAELTKGLMDYCTLDTLAMVRLARFFQGETQ